MRVEFLWWEGCPSYPEALADLREVLESERVDPSIVEMREIESDEQAIRERFPGSPTIRINGRDIVAPCDGEPFSLTCRVYRLRDGGYSATPDPADLQDGLRRARGAQ